jgi:hypothetical protein
MPQVVDRADEEKIRKNLKNEPGRFCTPFISFITQARARATQNTHVLR